MNRSSPSKTTASALSHPSPRLRAVGTVTSSKGGSRGQWFMTLCFIWGAVLIGTTETGPLSRGLALTAPPKAA